MKTTEFPKGEDLLANLKYKKDEIKYWGTYAKKLMKMRKICAKDKMLCVHLDKFADKNKLDKNNPVDGIKFIKEFDRVTNGYDKYSKKLY